MNLRKLPFTAGALAMTRAIAKRLGVRQSSGALVGALHATTTQHVCTNAHPPLLFAGLENSHSRKALPLVSTSFPDVRKVKVVNRILSITTPLFAALAALILLTGCSTARMYDGPAKTKDQLALLYRHANYVRILSLDGQKIPWMKRATVLELLPGPHTVQCSFKSEYMRTGYTSISSTQGPIRLSFDAQPGYSYWIDSNVDPFKSDWQPKIISRPSNKEEPAN